MPATHPAHNRIALAFDFDLTLAPGSMDQLVEQLGIEPSKWREERLHPLAADGWDEILATGYALIAAARQKRIALTRSLFREAGRSLQPFPGVAEMFDRLREVAAQSAPGVELTFHIVTSGFVDVIGETSVAGCFDSIWGSAFHFADEEVAFVKRTITHPEKARYLHALAKGLSIEGANAPADVGRRVPEEDMALPMDQLIYVGDGASDLDAFEAVEQAGGVAIAVLHAGSAADWDAQGKMRPGRRVENLARADFRPGTELMRSLELAVQSAACRLHIRRMAQGE